MTIALVTGGGRRVGAAIAARLAGAGYDLALHGHSSVEPEPSLLAAIETAGVRWAPFVADLSEERQVDALFPAIEAALGGRVTCLVNCASRFSDDGWDDVTMESLARHFAVNAAAPARLAQQLAARLGESEAGVVINILDQRVAAPPIDQAGYTASKMALAGITQALARALAPKVRVCGVAPGLTLPTPDYTPAQMERLAARMPLGRLPTPDDVADAVLFLAQAHATTGQVIFVDGGAAMLCLERDFVFLDRDEA